LAFYFHIVLPGVAKQLLAAVSQEVGSVATARLTWFWPKLSHELPLASSPLLPYIILEEGQCYVPY